MPSSQNGNGKKEKASQLVKQHLQIKNEPLVLAVYYAPKRDRKHVFLFEVIKGFGASRISPKKQLFEISFGNSEALPLNAGERMHLVLTSPEEMEVALKHGWRHARELVNAYKSHEFAILHRGGGHKRLLNLIKEKEAAGKPEEHAQQ